MIYRHRPIRCAGRPDLRLFILYSLICLIWLAAGRAMAHPERQGSEAVPIPHLVNGELIGSRVFAARTSEELSIDQILDGAIEFSAPEGTVPGFGYTEDIAWYRLSLDNEAAPMRLYFEFMGPVRLLEAWVTQDNAVQSYSRTGTTIIPAEEDPGVFNPFPTLAVTVPTGTSNIYFSLDSENSHFAVRALAEEQLASRIVVNVLNVSLFLGLSATLMAIIFALPFLFPRRTSVFLILPAYCLFMVISGFITGYYRLGYYLFPTTSELLPVIVSWLDQHWVAVLAGCTIFTSLFCYSRLGWRRIFHSQGSTLLFILGIGGQTVQLFLSFYSPVAAMQYFSACFGLSLLHCAVILFRISRGPRKEEWVSLTGVILFMLLTLGQLSFFLQWHSNIFLGVWGSVVAFFALIYAFAISAFMAVRRSSKMAMAYLESELQEKNQQLRSVLENERQQLQWARQVTRFLRHELGNQLIAIASTFKLIQRHTVSEKVGDYVERGNRSLNQLRKLLHKATDSMSLEDAVRLTERRSFRVAELIADEMFQIESEYRDTTFAVDVSVDFEILGDSTLMARALGNLVSNAVRHNRSGCSVVIRTAKPQRIIVENEGDPLNQDPAQLFKPGSQVGDNPGLYGLGLYIVRKIVETHGGRVWGESLASPQGAQFVIDLPSCRSPGDSSDNRDPAQSESD